MHEDIKLLLMCLSPLYFIITVGWLIIEVNYTSKEAAIKGFFIAILWPPYLVIRTIYRIGKSWADLPDTENELKPKDQ